MSSIQIIIHKKLNAIQRLCGFIGRNHQCEKTIQGKMIFCTCSEDCSKCCEQIKRDEYNDGYLICGTCYEKLSGEICTNCFCKICYVSVDEWCDCISE